MSEKSTTKRSPAKKGTAPKHKKQAGNLDVYRHAASVDVGSTAHYAAIDPRDSEEPVRVFGCLTPDLHTMARWMTAHKVTTVVLESTGVYWVPVAQVLESHGLEVCLVDARQARNLPGRKTDYKDCQWLQELHRYGLLSKVFLPDATMQPLRDYWRLRADFLRQGAREIHHMHKALELMNLQLHKVLTDVTGTSGQRIIQAILDGERDPQKLVTLCAPNVKNSPETFIKALTGEYREQHLFALAKAFETHHYFQRKAVECDERIQQYMATLEPKADPKEVREKIAAHPASRKRRKNLPTFDLRANLIELTGVDLTRIPGIDAVTAFTVITEQGTDMSHFSTEKHFASHLGLCPNHRITGGRVYNRATRRVCSRAATSLRLAAQSLYRSGSALGAYYRRMRAKLGAPKAITAAAHKLAKLIYRMLKYGEEYCDIGQQAYEERQKEQTLKKLKKQVSRMGYIIVDLETGEMVS